MQYKRYLNDARKKLNLFVQNYIGITSEIINTVDVRRSREASSKKDP